MRGIEPGRRSYHPPRDGRAIDWMPDGPALAREVSPGLTLADFLELAAELSRGSAPGEPTTHRALGTSLYPAELPYDWPWLRLDELWCALHRYGRYAATVKVVTLDRDKAARAGL